MSFIDKFYVESWYIAFRIKQSNGSIITNRKDPFIVIENDNRYWCADPFVVEYEGKAYVFFEAYDKKSNKGVIGYREINETEVGDIHIVIEEPYHLSYPFIYKDGSWYIMPESYENNNLCVYKAKKFPDLWEKKYVLLNNIKTVDSTILYKNETSMKLFLYLRVGNDESGVFKIVDIQNSEVKEIYSKYDENCVLRPGGKIIDHQEAQYRISQLCKNIYGEALLFNEILANSADEYKELEQFRIYVPDIQINSKVNRKYIGIHTYNSSENYEVIDLKENKFRIWIGIQNLFKAVVKRIWRKNDV